MLIFTEFEVVADFYVDDLRYPLTLVAEFHTEMKGKEIIYVLM